MGDLLSQSIYWAKKFQFPAEPDLDLMIWRDDNVNDS